METQEGACVAAATRGSWIDKTLMVLGLIGISMPVYWLGEMLTFDVKYIGDDISLSIWDDDPGKDDLIGTSEIKISSLCVGSGLDEWFKLFFHGREAGVIHLRAIWEPRGGPLG